MTIKNTELESLISDNTNSINQASNSANQNAALIDQITKDVLDNESSSASLNDIVAGLTTQLNTLESSLSTLTDGVSANQGSTTLDISEISASISSLSSSIATLETEVTSLYASTTTNTLSLTASVTSLLADVKTIQGTNYATDTSGLQTSINSLQASLNTIETTLPMVYIDSTGTIKGRSHATVGTAVFIGTTSYTIVDDSTITAQISAGNYNLVTTKVTSMTAMFKNNTSFNSDISFWDTSSVSTTYEMF